MGFFSFLKYTFIIFTAHLATSCGAPFENHWPILTSVFFGFPESLHENAGTVPRIRPQPLPFTSFLIRH
jgi:hypothetical protein